MMHNTSERPGLVDRLAAHRDQQKAVPAQHTGHIDLDQLRSRLATANPVQVDHMVEEVEELRFGHEAFDLAQEYLAAGKVDRARHWLAVAARHDIDEAKVLLADVDTILEALGSLEFHQAPADTDSATHEQADAGDERRPHTTVVDDVHDAAEALRQTHAHAQSIVRADQQSADGFLAEARSRDVALADLWKRAIARWTKDAVSMPANKKEPEPPGLAQVQFLTVAEVATMMRVSKMTVFRLVHNGELPAVRVGKSFRVPEQAVHDYLRSAYFDAG